MSNIKKNNIDNNELEKRTLMALIDRGMRADDIPEGIKPENMMSHIKQLKEEGYFEERENKSWEAERQFKIQHKLRRIRRWGIAIACVALLGIVLFVPFGEFGYKDNPYSSYQELVDNVKRQNANGDYVLAGYKELSQYMVASKSLEIKPPEVVESLFDKFVSSFEGIGVDKAEDLSEENWEDLSGDANFGENQYGGDSDYSDTNVRTEGVSEADVIKTDGQYIYYIDDDFGRIQLVMAKADGENTTIVSKTEVDYDLFKNYSEYYSDGTTRFSIAELFVYEDRVVVIMSGYRTEGDDYNKYKGYSTLMLVYDTSNVTEPELVADFELDGKYESSRMVDGYVYLFTYKSAYSYVENKIYTEDEACKLLAPEVDGEAIAPENIYIAGNNDFNTYKIIATLDVKNPADLKDVKVVFGDGHRLTSYVSTEYIYFLTNVRYKYSENMEKEIGKIIATDQIEILKFDYEDGNVKLVDKAMVDGTLGDEFDIDEYNGYLRMAVTVDKICYHPVENRYTFYDGVNWFDFDRVDYNSYYVSERSSELFVLDEKLEPVGKVTLQMDERVYGVRFDGDTAYVVTFRETDPLFSVDLSDPAEPRIMGKLKIPGFSTYIHKWDENTLVGIGYVASVGSQVKISTFDISDKYDIVEKDVCKLPSNGRSDAPNNHKEIFISPEKNLIGMWLTGNFLIDEENYNAAYMIYSYVDGELTQVIKCPLSDEWNADSTRGMYIGNYIYVVNVEEGIFVYSMEDFAQLAHAE